MSIDIDIFTDKEFDAVPIGAYLDANYGLTDSSVIKSGVFGFIEEVKVDMLVRRIVKTEPKKLTDSLVYNYSVNE